MSSVASFGLHSGYFHPLLRAWQAGGGGGDVHVGPENIMMPVFIVDDPNDEQVR